MTCLHCEMTEILARGMCKMHYHRWHRGANPAKRTRFSPQTIEVDGDVARILIRRNDQSIKAVALIDADDVALVSEYRWTLVGKGYVAALKDGKRVYLHRLVTGAPDGLDVDHVHHNPLDNRKAELRVCTRTENHYNQRRNMKAAA